MHAARAALAMALVGVVSASCALDDEDLPTFGQAQKAMSVCADGPTVYGIDVSRFQGDIDWQKVADSGVVYAWIQISRHVDDIDAKFEYNWAQAKQVGILRGAYQRFHPGESVTQQAQIFLDKLGGEVLPGDMPPMLDVEDADGLPPATVAARVQEWMDIVEPALGVKPIIYTGYYFWKDSVQADFSDHPLWIANYGTDCPLVPASWTRWTFHQYSSTATIPGITANTVDVNRFNGTMDDLLALSSPPECGDGMCTGNEDSDSCIADCEPCQVIGKTGDIVDDTSECFRAGGPQQYIRTESAGHGGSLKWTHATDAAAAANFGVWKLHFEQAGLYRVEAHTPAPWAMSKQAVYQIEHGGQATASEVDQTAVDGWTAIADLEFAAGGGQSIRVDDNTGEPNETNTKIVFDALRLTRLDAIDDGDIDQPDEDQPEVEAGCQAADSPASSGTLLGLLLLALMFRRRRAC